MRNCFRYFITLIIIPALLGIHSSSAQDCTSYNNRIEQANEYWAHKNYEQVEEIYREVLKELEVKNTCVLKQLYLRINLARYYGNFHLKYDALKQYEEILSLAQYLDGNDQRRITIVEDIIQFMNKNRAFEDALPLVLQLHSYYEVNENLKNLLNVKLLLLNIYMEIDDWDRFEAELDIVNSEFFEETLISNNETLKEYFLMNHRFAMYANNKEKAYKMLDLIVSYEDSNDKISSSFRELSTYHYFDDWSERLTDRLIKTVNWSKEKIINDFKNFDSIGSQEDYISFLETRYDLFNSIVFTHKIKNQTLMDDIGFIKQFILRYRLNQLKTADYSIHDPLVKYLEQNETYIEYSSFNYHNGLYLTDEVRYYALIYKQKWINPKMIELFKEKEILTYLNVSETSDAASTRGGKAGVTSNRKNIYDLIFKPLESFITENETLFILPSGLLHQISFESLQVDSVFLSNKYRIKRVSNLSNKATQNNTSVQSIALFGDIDYGRKNYDKNCNKFWSYLPGTKKEIESLDLVVQNEGVKTYNFADDYATESAFKNLSGNSPDIIHVATHGFFMKNANKSDNVNLSSTSNDLRLFDNPLVKSGLVFYNGNATCTNDNTDGILTSLEISRLDLSDTELVVLSACDTGLGDVLGYEGVYGLQRAFLMAGVDNILMSLWEVDDEGTAIFMKIFYEYFIDSNDISQALASARKKMQSLYKSKKGFEDQRLYASDVWSAFVLLQGS